MLWEVLARHWFAEPQIIWSLSLRAQLLILSLVLLVCAQCPSLPVPVVVIIVEPGEQAGGVVLAGKLLHTAQHHEQFAARAAEL